MTEDDDDDDACLDFPVCDIGMQVFYLDSAIVMS